jgi:hypothetical protein
VPAVKSRLRDTKLAKNISEVSAAFLKVRVPGILTKSRHTDECCSTTRENFLALRRTERLRGSMHFGVLRTGHLRVGFMYKFTSYGTDSNIAVT